MLIQNVSLLQILKVVALGIRSIGIIAREDMSWPGKLKCLPIGSSLFFSTDCLCCVNRIFNPVSVLPTYCFLQTKHVIRYMTLNDLQLKECLILYSLSVTLQIKKSISYMKGQVKHRLSLHLWYPRGFGTIGSSLAYTKYHEDF